MKFILLFLYCMVIHGKVYFNSSNYRNHLCSSPMLRKTERYYCTANEEIICINGWSNSSSYCNVPICQNGCSNNGDCIYPETCSCHMGWDGSNCNKCIPLPGCKHGYCNFPFQCICDDGYKGHLCKDVVCPKACKLGKGFCTKPNICECTVGWIGPNCTQCMTLPSCQHGYCQNNAFECKCYPGYTGFKCNQAICKEGCDLNHGHCNNAPGECICELGWKGENCTECVPNPNWNCSACIDNIPWTCAPTKLNILNVAVHENENYSKWSEWSHCTALCVGDTGTREKIRTCLNSVNNCLEPLLVEETCIGDLIPNQSDDITALCFILPVNEDYSEWNEWTECNASCIGDIGKRKRFRMCINLSFNMNCSLMGHFEEQEDCFGSVIHKQSFDPNSPCYFSTVEYSSWSSWYPCTARCVGDEGFRTRERKCHAQNGNCKDLGPSYEQQKCFGNLIQKQKKDPYEPCYDLNGGYTEWNQWRPCTAKCIGDKGTRKRVRTCTNEMTCDVYGPSFEIETCDGNPNPKQSLNPNAPCFTMKK